MITSSSKKILGMDQHEFSVFMKRYGIGIIMIGMIVILSIVTPDFRRSGNIISILLQVSLNGILALGMVFVITAGGIDLSIGSQLAVTSVIIGLVLRLTGNILLACVLAISVTAIFGLVNGILVAKFNMVPFVATLATQLIIRGFAYVISGGYSESLANPDFKKLGNGRLFSIIPYPVIALLIF